MPDDFPPRKPDRWLPQSKAKVLNAIHRGLITVDDACAYYTLTKEELMLWQQAFAKKGIEGLRVTRLDRHKRSRNVLKSKASKWGR